MKTLRSVKFSPQQGIAVRYWDEDGFRSNDEIATASLTESQQAVVSAAVAWALSQLPSGFAVLESIDLRRVSDVVTEWSVPASPEDQPQVVATSPAFSAAIVGNGEKGQQAIEINSAPGPETTALAGLWDELSI